MSDDLKPGQRSRVFFWLAGIAVAGGIAAVAVTTYRAGDAASPAPTAPQATPVSVATVETQDVMRWQEFSGRLEAVERVDIRSRVAGQVLDVPFREGSLVDEGDLLVLIDPAPFEAEVARAEAQVASARTRLAFTKKENERAVKLADTGTVPVREKDSRANDYREAQAALRAAEAQLKTAILNLGYTEIRAPVSGRVGKALITEGNLVAAGAGAPVLTTLVSIDPIYATFDVDEKIVMQALHDLKSTGDGSLDVGRIPVEMEGVVAGADTVHGQLQMIDNVVDAASGTIRVRAVFPNPDGMLIPGQFARLRMGQANSSPLLLITERAVANDQDRRYVLVVDDENKAQYREVTLGAEVGQLRIVTSGLKSGERIIVSGLQRVRPGAPVQPEMTGMTPGSGPAPDASAETAER